MSADVVILCLSALGTLLVSGIMRDAREHRGRCETITTIHVVSTADRIAALEQAVSRPLADVVAEAEERAVLEASPGQRHVIEDQRTLSDPWPCPCAECANRQHPGYP